MRCPVLTYHSRYQPMCFLCDARLRAHYALSGTDKLYGATQSGTANGGVPYVEGTYRATRSLCDVRHWRRTAIVLDVCYAMSGTDRARTEGRNDGGYCAMRLLGDVRYLLGDVRHPRRDSYERARPGSYPLRTRYAISAVYYQLLGRVLECGVVWRLLVRRRYPPTPPQNLPTLLPLCAYAAATGCAALTRRMGVPGAGTVLRPCRRVLRAAGGGAADRRYAPTRMLLR
eukprot:401778-Rhodomonas_salina.2